MALTYTEMITEVQALTGRENDTVLITSARVLRWLNEGQLEIALECTGHLDLETKHATALTLVASTYSYSFSAITPTVLHLLTAFYMDGTGSKELLYRDTEDFDRDHPIPSLQTGIPNQYTRRGSTIEIYPAPSSAEAGKYIRLDYTKRPTDMSIAQTTSQLVDSDKGLIYYAVAEAFRAIGGDKVAEANLYRDTVNKTGWFYDWLYDYKLQKDGRYHSAANRLFD